MNEGANLQARTDQELAESLRETDTRARALVQSASEKFKLSEQAGWDESLYGEGDELLVELKRLFEETAPIEKELERRIGPALLEEQIREFTLGSNDNDQRWYHKDLTTQEVPTTGTIDEQLPEALENLLGRVSKSWWREQQSLANEAQRNLALQPLLLCGRDRRGVNLNLPHKYAYYLSVADHEVKKEPHLDFYTAARAVPQIYYLGASLETLRGVEGASRKLRELWRAPSKETDSRIYELLVAAAFARMGHKVSFIPETDAKSPDLRLHDEPIPIVVECKRKQTLNSYEEKEFSVIEEVFATLCVEREELGLVGDLTVDFNVELINLTADDIVQSVREITRSLSPYVSKETAWGTLHFKPVSVSTSFEPTRLYSPDFLNRVFGINLEMDEFDGICAVVKNDQSPVVGRAELPFLMRWTSNSKTAFEKKLKTIKSLWIEAVSQIPTGEAGLIYLAYEEGHRPSLADARTDAIRELTQDIYFHRRAISIPMTVISRILPNTLLEGRPDLIENAIPAVDGDNDARAIWPQLMPTRVFTP